MNKKICLWSCPRNVSTALMYSFRERPDMEVYDEPLYAHYLNSTNLNHPGKKEILSSLEIDWKKVVYNVILKNREKNSFFKLMTHFLVDVDKSFLKDVQNIIFIRDPKEIIYSYSKVIKKPSISDIGVKMQYDLYLYLKSVNINVIVLDSKKLLINPKKTLIKLCDLLNIPFYDTMLNWERGSKEEDGVWAKYWYENVHNTTCFLPYKKRLDIQFNSSQNTLYNECKYYYNLLTKLSI